MSVPAFSPASKADPAKALTRVRLYFLPDGSVAAERFREIRSRGDKLAIRSTGLPPSAQPYASCGGAYAGYSSRTVELLAN